MEVWVGGLNKSAYSWSASRKARRTCVELQTEHSTRRGYSSMTWSQILPSTATKICVGLHRKLLLVFHSLGLGQKKRRNLTYTARYDWLNESMMDWLVGWLIDWWIYWPIDWLIDWLIRWDEMVIRDFRTFFEPWFRKAEKTFFLLKRKTIILLLSTLGIRYFSPARSPQFRKVLVTSD